MQSNHKKLREFITPIKLKNKDLRAKDLLGINIDKFFMPSVANIVGTDLSRYKVVEKNQFACNRMHVGRDYRIPIALSDKEEPFMVSPAYDVFEINDMSVLLPDYLMMWFSRKEFDRNAWFYTDADVRGGLAWDAFCNMEFPLPSIEKQRAIVAEYNTIKNRITLNNQLIQKMEETAQAIYKQWFVDFDFPSEALAKDGVPQPYKSSGGKMVWCEELEKEIPQGWICSSLEEVSNKVCVAYVGTLYDDYRKANEGVQILRTTNLSEDGISYSDLNFVSREFHEKNKKSQLLYGDILIARHGSNGQPVIYDSFKESNALNVIILRPDFEKAGSKLLFCHLKSSSVQEYLKSSTGGSVQEVLNTKIISLLKIPVPLDYRVTRQLSNLLERVQKEINLKRKERKTLYELIDVIHSKLIIINN